MNPERQQALDYLRAPADALWRWAENGAVLVWHDGTTIAFREEIVQIIEWLAPNGLPSFGSIIFLLAACRGKVPQVSDIIVESPPPLPSNMGRDATVLLSARKQLKAQLESALDQLAKVSRLASVLNGGIKARCVLAEAVFEPAKAERHVQASTVLAGMREPMSDTDLRESLKANVTGSFIRQIHIVAEGLKPHTAESLTSRMHTGLDELPKAADVNLPPAEQARNLIEELSRDDELGYIARAAREIMAALRLPRRLGELEQLSLGGVADITNRGPLDRLLLSELAHDDLTLSVRIALNEALYLRREPPVREPPGSLMLLLDSGVRLWGVPRVLATAVALALIARDKQHSNIGAWRGHKAELQKLDLLSRNGLTQHLSALEIEAHPGPSLDAFAAVTTGDVQNQSVLITHRDTLEDPEFRRAISDHPGAPAYIAVVDRQGRFELHGLPLSHRPPLCAADIDLASVFAEKPGVMPIKKTVEPDLPAIFGMVPFPFLLPIAGKVDFWIKAPDGFIYAVLNDRRLVQFRDQLAGGRFVAGELPNGKTLWMCHAEGTLYLVKAGASQRPARLVTVSLPYGDMRVTDLVAGEEVKAVYCYGDVIVLIRGGDVRAHSLGDGRMLERILNPHRWLHGRYFVGQNHFYFAVWDGAQLKFEPVTLPDPLTTSVISRVFDREGLEGPWLVDKGGQIIPTGPGAALKLPMPPERKFGLEYVRISRDGHRLYAAIESVSWGQLMNLQSGTVHNILPARSKKLDLDQPPQLPARNLFHAVTAIARLGDGLAFCGRKDRWRKLARSNRGEFYICEATPDDLGRLSLQQSFAVPPKETSHGCSLQVAEWPCGSKAFLDSRGMLHLKSYAPAVPEVSLLLADDGVAGWTSDGQFCGPQFFFEAGHISRPDVVWDRILKFLSRL